MIALVCPLEIEAKSLLSWVEGIEWYRFHKRTWGRFHYRGEAFEVVVTTVGAERAEKALLQMLEKQPQFVIHFGSAGAIDPQLSVGDMVVASETLESATSSTPLKAEACFLELATKYPALHQGLILSADRNVENLAEKQQLFEQYHAACCDWESAVMMRVCHQHQVPAVTLRVITDLADNQAREDFAKHHERLLLEAAPQLKDYIDSCLNHFSTTSN